MTIRTLNPKSTLALRSGLGQLERGRKMMDASHTDLFKAISDESVQEMKRLLEAGADPNARNEYDETPLQEACNNSHSAENRFAMVEALIAAGADPAKVDKEGGGPLFECVIAKDTRLIEYLLQHGADPNKENDLGEPLYDWAEFDYRYDEFGLNPPEEPTEADKKDEDAWLHFLSRLAAKFNKKPPDYLFVLRRAGAMTWQEKQAQQGSAGQPATRSESDSEGSDECQPEVEGRSR